MSIKYPEDFIVDISNGEPWFKIGEEGIFDLYLDKWTYDHFNGVGQEVDMLRDASDQLLLTYGFKKPSIIERKLWLSLSLLYGAQ